MNNPSQDINKTVRIKIAGQLDAKWSHWFEELSIDYDNDNTILSGTLPDQAALYGLLNKIRDLNLTLISVDHIEQ